MDNYKICPKCQIDKPKTEYHDAPSDYYCKSCNKEMCRENRIKRRGKLLKRCLTCKELKLGLEFLDESSGSFMRRFCRDCDSEYHRLKLQELCLCRNCQTTKNIRFFPKDNRSTCRDCCRKRQKESQLVNPKLLENKRDAGKRYVLFNKQKIKDKRRIDGIANPNRRILRIARNRAKRDGLDFNLELCDIIIPEYCPVLGIKLKLDNVKKQDNSPSIDRIDNDKGYIKGNIMIISDKANMIKNCGTAEEHEKIAKWMRENGCK